MMAGTWPRLPALGQPRTRYATSIASFSANFCSVLRPAGPSAFWYGSSRTSLRAVPPADWGKILVWRYILSEIHPGRVSTGRGMVPRRVRLPSAPYRREMRSPLGNLCFRIVGYLALSGYSGPSNTNPTADICHCDSVSRPHRRAFLVVLAPQREFVCARRRPLLD